MLGVIVVPTGAASVVKYPVSGMNDGVTRACATSPQLGWARNAAPTYVNSAVDNRMKIFSATVYDARTTINHTTTAMSGTLTSRGMSNRSPAAAIPANSAIVTVLLATISTNIANADHLTPNSSRIRSPHPFPATTPMRATMIWTPISAMVIGPITHSCQHPYRPPLTPYQPLP